MTTPPTVRERLPADYAFVYLRPLDMYFNLSGIPAAVRRIEALCLTTSEEPMES